MKHREEKNFLMDRLSMNCGTTPRGVISHVIGVPSRASLIAQLVKNLPAMQDLIPGSGRSPGEERGYHSSILGLPCGSAGKESACNAGDLGSISGLGRSPWEGKGYSPQYSGLENSMDCIVHGVTKSRTQLSDFHFHFSKEEGSRRTPK